MKYKQFGYISLVGLLLLSYAPTVFAVESSDKQEEVTSSAVSLPPTDSTKTSDIQQTSDIQSNETVKEMTQTTSSSQEPELTSRMGEAPVVTPPSQGFSIPTDAETFGTLGTVKWYLKDGELHISSGTLPDVLPGYLGPFYDISEKVSSITFQGDINAGKSLRRLFLNFKNLLSIINLNYLDTTNTESMREMFGSCTRTTNLDLSNFNTGKVEDMNSMFDGCKGLVNLDLSNFNTSQVKDMGAMFYGCEKLTSINLISFSTVNVINMGIMFTGCKNLTSLNLSNFQTDQVMDMNAMFSGCSGITYLDLENFDTSNVIDMSYMFYGCRNLTSIDLSKFNTQYVYNMNGMFDETYQLFHIKLGYNSKFNSLPILSTVLGNGWYKDRVGNPYLNTNLTTGFDGTIMAGDWYWGFNSSSPTFTSIQTANSIHVILDKDESALYGEVQYKWDNGAWRTSPDLTQLKSSSAHTVSVRYARKDGYANSPEATETISTKSATYTISIPSTPMIAGKSNSSSEIKVNDKETFDLGYGGQVNVKVNDTNSITPEGKLLLTREGDSQTKITSSILVDNQPLSQLSQNIATFKTETDIPVTLSFGKPESSLPKFPVGKYQGVMMLEVSYSE